MEESSLLSVSSSWVSKLLKSDFWTLWSTESVPVNFTDKFITVTFKVSISPCCPWRLGWGWLALLASPSSALLLPWPPGHTIPWVTLPAVWWLLLLCISIVILLYLLTATEHRERWPRNPEIYTSLYLALGLGEYIWYIERAMGGALNGHTRINKI